ncbi:MAG TPA: hypothetical protein VFT32_12115 [Candidatus Eisenbacteria bacterium]|nr:hypothetical protein [Candidatus Eisenbacteria bacterium]
MFALLLGLLPALQDPPAIQDLKPVMGEYARSGCWLPVVVRVTGPADFEGQLAGYSDAGFRVLRPFRLPSSGSLEILVPVVVLAADAKIEFVLRGPAGDLQRKPFTTPQRFLARERLVLIDPRHPEADSLLGQDLALPSADATPVRFAVSDPAWWNEAADMGALEAADAVIASEAKASELVMIVWRALGGSIVTQPRRDLVARLGEPAARFPVVDPAVGRFSNSESWIPRKRDATLLFIVVYGFGLFVAVYLTWSRRGGAWLLAASALGMAGLFIAAYGAFYPKGHLAFRTWQAIVDAPHETPVAVTISQLWGEGRAGDLEFGRILKPVCATAQDARRRPLDLRWSGEGRWFVSGAAPGDPTRFVSVENLRSVAPHQIYKDKDGRSVGYKAEETQYFMRIPRKDSIRLQDPETGAPPPGRTEGILETPPARVFRVKLRE